MKRIPKSVLITTALLLLAGVTLVAAASLLAPTKFWNVTPVPKTFPADKACPTGSWLVEGVFQSVTEDPEGTYSYSTTIDGMPVTIEVTTYADNSFDFNIIGGVTPQMFVKGGKDSGYLLYQYDPKVLYAINDGPVSYDTGVHDGYVSSDMYQDVSHLDFCIIPKGYPLTAEKTASTSYTREYTWDIDKEYDGEYWKFIGDAATIHDYLVSVDQTIDESLFKVYGTITVYNSNAFAVDTTISDSVGGVEATLSCDGSLTVPANGSATCDYYAYLGTKTDGTNTATITSLNKYVDGATATKAYTFGEPTDVVGYPTITVTDSFYGPLGSASADKTFATYYKSFQCSTNQAEYTNGVWTMTEFVNTATIDETGQSDDAYVNLTCYAPVLDKDAFTNWEEKYTWTITKDYDQAYKGFIGDPAFDHDYEVFVDQTVTPQNFKVYGSIYVSNPAGSPGNMTVSLADELAAGVFATVDCGSGATSVTVAPGATGTCAYSGYLAAKTDGTNTARGSFNGVSFVTTESFVFGAPTIVGFPTINVTDSFAGALGSASGDYTFYYSKSFQCETDQTKYTNGVWTMTEFVNTATIDETGQSDNAYVNLTCYAPVLDKDASTSWEERYDWEITKEPDGTYKGFIGDPAFYHDYTVEVDLTKVPQNFKVYGKIYVFNPAGSPGNMTVSLADKLAEGVFATVDCGSGATSITVAPNATGTCDYSGYLASKTDGTNTATGTFNGISFVTTETYAFGAAVPVGFATINVTDDKYGPLGSASDDKTFTYTGSFQCSTKQSDYINGVWVMEDFVNTASIDEISTKYDSATVKLTCYAPVLTKDASASYDERHIWDVDKTVNPELQGGFPGSVLPWTWTVTVSETFVEESFLVTGVITVTNPAGSPGDMLVSLVDQLNDGTFATVDCSGETSITVAPGYTGVCSYTADPDGRTATLNTATGTFNLINFVATAPVSFVKNVVNGTATVTDTEIGLNESLTAGFGPWTFDRDYSHTCSTNRADYFVDGVYTQGKWTITNWAYVYSGGVEQDKDDATTTYTCDASFVDIYKTTNGAPADPTKDIQFALYSGTKLLSTVSTLGNGAALAFPTALIPGNDYTICEYPVPAGYTFEISVDGGVVLTYAGPPGTEYPTGDVQCFDFEAKASGTTITFSIENRYPGGAPRTPGYWKNWNTCTGGNQQYTAIALGGVEAGVYLLDDLLLQTLGSLTIDTCEVGVQILSAYDIETLKNMNSDAAYMLAKSLLAARLNQDAGACVVPTTTTWSYDGETYLTFEQVLIEADKLLAKYGFDGSGPFLSSKDKKVRADYNYALWLNGIIDGYNNSMFCTGEPSH